MHQQICTVEEALEELRSGRLIITIDDPDRENEGDLICAARFATTENVNFMAVHGKGLICTPMSEEVAARLGLEQMVKVNTDNHCTAFTVSIDHVDTTTGISAEERGYTCRKCVDLSTRPGDLRRPGHVFPLVARRGGVLVRNGHTEATVDLMSLAGLPPCGVLCELTNDDGTMARLPQVADFARANDLPLLAVFFLTRAAESQGLPTPRLSRGALRKLQEYHWPGNVRELQNCLTRALAFCENGLIFAENIQLGPDTLPGDIARPERGKLSCPPARADSRQPHGEAAETAESPVAQPVPAESEDQGAMPAAEDAQPRLNARLARLLPQIVELGSISRQEYQDMAGKDISMRTAQYDLQILVRLGLVRREGRGPAQRYIVLPAARGFRA